MGHCKILGPYGIHIRFYKDNWSLVGPYIIQTALKIVSGQQTLNPFNYYDLFIIPKSNNTNTQNDFCPIGLCNTFYKLSQKPILNT